MKIEIRENEPKPKFELFQEVRCHHGKVTIVGIEYLLIEDEMRKSTPWLYSVRVGGESVGIAEDDLFEINPDFREVQLILKVPKDTPDPKFSYFQKIPYSPSENGVFVEGEIVGIEYMRGDEQFCWDSYWCYSVRYVNLKGEIEVQSIIEEHLLERIDEAATAA